MSEVFSTGQQDQTFTVTVGDTDVEVSEEVTKEDCSEIASENGVGKFQVVKKDGGEGVSSEDFPVQTDVRLLEYNENA